VILAGGQRVEVLVGEHIVNHTLLPLSRRHGFGNEGKDQRKREQSCNQPVSSNLAHLTFSFIIEIIAYLFILP
jgi:hypothetical protein